jgi:hypothetical protein
MLQKVKKGDLALGAPARMFPSEFPPAWGATRKTSVDTDAGSAGWEPVRFGKF